MRLPRPRSLAAQMALLLGVALFVAQLANFALILNERQKLSLARVEGPAIERFAEVAAAGRLDPIERAGVPGRWRRFSIDPASAVPFGARDPAIEKRLAVALRNEGVRDAMVRAGAVTIRLRPPGRPDVVREIRLLRLSLQLADGRWLNGRAPIPRRDPWLAVRLAAATLLLYLIVLGATAWLALRLARPLRALTEAAERFDGRTLPPRIAADGPDDLRRAIEAFNAMAARLAALIDEKDRMLGALGHDLRTPLAALRIRIESMEPESERLAAVARIDAAAALLEDILTLARTGRAREPSRPVDLAALVEAVAEDRIALGQQVTAEPAAPLILTAPPGLVRRAIDNLVDNAVKYAGAAQIDVAALPGGGAVVRVRDTGPGIPPDRLAEVLEPFARLEASRNRETGGSGLGLAIARNIAEALGGTLRLAPGEPSGLVATLEIGDCDRLTKRTK